VLKRTVPPPEEPLEPLGVVVNGMMWGKRPMVEDVLMNLPELRSGQWR
jgi:hypothetical protein